MNKLTLFAMGLALISSAPVLAADESVPSSETTHSATTVTTTHDQTTNPTTDQNTADKTTTTTEKSTHFDKTAKEDFKKVHVKDLATWMKSEKTVFVYDANNEDTRTKYGVIPGAKILASYNNYDVSQTLPADKNAKLVFYCANTMCMASHEAAKRATAAGYKDVNVMADGIQGWKKAGKPTEKVPQAM